MTHHQLVEEWKGKVKQALLDAYHAGGDDGSDYIELGLKTWEASMLAAAKGAAEASKLYGMTPREWIGHSGADGWNTAISQSERQLEDYFKEI